MEGKSCDGHEVGLSVGESDRDYAQGGGIRWSGFISLSGYFALLYKDTPTTSHLSGRANA